MSGYRVEEGDVVEVLGEMAPGSVQCCVTSPPYWGLRCYQTEPQVWGGVVGCGHEWGMGVRTPWANNVSGPNGANKNGEYSRHQPKEAGPFCALCGAWRGELGLEPTPELCVEHLVTVFREVRRVLRDDGTLWLNIGDSYATGGGAVGECPGGGVQGARYRGDHDKDPKATGIGPQTQPNRMPIAGLKPKDLVGIPWMVAFALRADGWYLRMDNVWSKKNCMPESVRDRCTKSHEYVFQLTKSERYYYDADAIAEPLATDEKENYPAREKVTGRGTQGFAAERGGDRDKSGGFPPSTRVGSPVVHGNKAGRDDGGRACNDPSQYTRNHRSVWSIGTKPFRGAHFAVMPEELAETCVLAGCPSGGVVLDPFCGSGTVGVVALRHGRSFVGVELNPRYVRLAHRRIMRSAPLLHAAPVGVEVCEGWMDMPLFTAAE